MLKQKLPFVIVNSKRQAALQAENKKLSREVSEAYRLIKEIEKGNLESTISFGDASEHNLMAALLSMRGQMKYFAAQERERQWVTEGLAKFVDILRGSESLESLSNAIISNLVKYLDANQGGLFIVNDDSKQHIFLELLGTYAYHDEQIEKNKTVESGEGLIGQVYVNKKEINLQNLPPNYLTIASGLGLASPAHLIIVPLMSNEVVYGIVEIASFSFIDAYKIEFVKRIGENIAAAIAAAKVNDRTRQMLEESLGQQELLRLQEDEMRQNVTELHEAQAFTQRLSSELEEKISVINKTLAIIEFDKLGNILTVNDNFLKIFGYKADELIGQHHAIFVEEQERKGEGYRQFWIELGKGKEVRDEFKRITKKGKEIWIQVYFTPALDAQGNVKKIVEIIFDITPQKRLERQVKTQLEQMREQEKAANEQLKALALQNEELTEENKILKNGV